MVKILLVVCYYLRVTFVGRDVICAVHICVSK